MALQAAEKPIVAIEISQGPTLVGPQIAFVNVGFSPCDMPPPSISASLLEFFRISALSQAARALSIRPSQGKPSPAP